MRTPLTTAVLLANACLLPTAFAQTPPVAAPATAAPTATQNSPASAATAATAPTAAPAPAAAATATPPATAAAASASAATAAATAAPAAGPTTSPALNPVVVTATRTPQRLDSAIPQTTVFTAADIAKSNQTDLPSLLQEAPGAQIVTNGGPGSATSLFLRGAASNQTLFLIDGVRIDSASLATAQLEQIMLAQVDRVEVVNGNVSSLYGSGAIGGVVQVFTKDGGDHPPRFSVETELGSYHTQRQQVGVNGALDADGSTTFSVTLARFKTDGFSAINSAEEPDANPNANGYSNTSVGATIKHRFGENWDAGVRLYEVTGRLSYDNAFGAPTDLNETDNRVRSLSAFADGTIGERWTTHLIVAQGDDQSTNLLNGQFASRFNTRNQQLTWQNEFAIAPRQKFVFGYERLNQSLDTDEYAPPERQVNSGYVGYEGRFGANQFQLNVRRDQYSDLGGANSYYAGYGYNLTAQWKLLASISDAFRAPSFNDLYFPDYGNPDLRPEESHSIEAGVQYSSDTLGVCACHRVSDPLCEPDHLRRSVARQFYCRECRPCQSAGNRNVLAWTVRRHRCAGLVHLAESGRRDG